MKKVIFIIILISQLFFGCKRNQNTIINTYQESDNSTNIDEQYLYSESIEGIIVQDNINSDRPIIIGDVIQFSDSYSVDIWNEHCYYKIDNINIYETYNKESNFQKITDSNIKLFKLPYTEDWLYCYVTNDVRGYIYIYDISKESFYGDFEENRKSFNFYRMLLIREYEIITKYSNFRRYGPLLEINYNNTVIRFWDSFTGEMAQRYQLLDYYEGTNEIFIREQYYEGSSNHIYNLRLNNYVCTHIGNLPIFNERRSFVFSTYVFYADPMKLKIFSIANGIYENILDVKIFEDEYINIINQYWINNNEFIIETEENGNLLVKINRNIELIYE
ncbi:MAG: hypothetical protein LBI28_11280 [Treponema sp.]|nr:hypothetical protein [Treponema sp.]